MFKKLFHYLGNDKKYLVVCFLLVFSEVVAEMTIPLLMARIVDVGIPHQDISLIMSTGGLMTLLALTGIILGVLNMWFSARVSQRFASHLRTALFRKIQTFSFSNIDQFESASLVTRLTNDVSQLQTAVLMMLRILLRSPLMLISAIMFALSINFQLSIVIFISVPLLVGFILLLVRLAGQVFGKMQQRLDHLNGMLQENLIGIRVVKAFVREKYEIKKFDTVNRDLTKAALEAGNLISLIMPFMFLIMNGTSIAVIWLGGQMVNQGLIGTGSLVSFISYLMQILMSVMFFSMIFILVARAKASAQRVLEVLETKVHITDPAKPIKKKITSGKIEFREVNFGYQREKDRKNVLSDLSFTIEPGEIVGIIGGTGSGKTTLINLIPRLFEVSSGSVVVDGVDVRHYPLAGLRRGMGMVLQKNVLFSGTIRENLLWGNQNATQAQIEKACQIACAYDFIMDLPGHYDTVLGQGGVNVSGGQKQRLCIARALLKDPAILLLDDSTSALDTVTESKIQNAFRRELKHCTVLLIAQRISSVKDLDKIIVLEDGRISGIGTHHALLETNPVYKEICSSQQEGLEH